jgi:hypothetical protein
MAIKNKKSGMGKLISLILGGATTKKAKRTKPASEKVSKRNVGVTPDIGNNRSFSTKTTASSYSDIKFRARMSSIASMISLETGWDALGRDTAMSLDNENDRLLDVTNDSDQFDDIQSNFDLIQREVNILSKFMIKLDYRFRDLSRNVGAQ